MIVLLMIFLVFVAVAIGIPFWRIWKDRQAEAALRDNPPELIRFQVKLPADSSQSNVMMTRFWDRIHRHLPADAKSVEANTNTLHATVVGYGAERGRAPRLLFMVWCHPSLAEKLQLDLSECYVSEAQITVVDETKDPFGQWMLDYRAQVEYRQQLAAVTTDDPDEDA